jgi:RimJ/RimL family protein N-acetyltransferase
MAWPRLTERIEGELVVVEPLAAEHEAALYAAGQGSEIWTYLNAFPDAAASPDRFHVWMEQALAAAREGSEGAWVIIERATGTPVGSTRYLALRPEDHGLEIGWTWVGKPWWRTGINVETKLLLMDHAFGTLGCERVELKTDSRNARSRAAMEALPAQFEGIHRHHMKLVDGWRDSAYYSVIAPEWPAVRANLRRRLAAHDRATGGA